MWDSPLTPRPVPRLYSAPPPVAGAPDTFVDDMSIAAAAARSVLPRGVPTPGRDAWLEQRQREDDEYDELFARYGDGEDERSPTDEKDSDSDYEGEDPDVGKNGAPQKPRSRKKPERNGPRQRRWDAGIPPRNKCPCEMPDDERAEHERAKAEMKAKKDAAGADEFETAVKAFEASPWVEEDNYLAIVDELKKWVARGGTAATAAGWIGRLMIATSQKMGGKGYTPSTVRALYRKTPPGPAKVESKEEEEDESESESEEDDDDADEVMPQPKKRGAPRTRGA